MLVVAGCRLFPLVFLLLGPGSSYSDTKKNTYFTRKWTFQ